MPRRARPPPGSPPRWVAAPPHVAAHAAQSLHVLHVGPEVPAALEEADHVVWRHDYARAAHGALPTSASKPIRSIERDSMAQRTLGSQSVRSSSSRSSA